MTDHRTIVLVGNIGVGKTYTMEAIRIRFEKKELYGQTIMHRGYDVISMRDNRDIVLVHEPVQEWTEAMRPFYQAIDTDPDLKKHESQQAFVDLQLTIAKSFEKIGNLMIQRRNATIVCERSIWCASRVFSSLLLGKLSPELRQQVVDAHQKVENHEFWRICNLLFFYIREDDPQILLDNIGKRGRVSECRITADYLKELDRAHESFFQGELLTKDESVIITVKRDTDMDEYIANIIKKR